MWPAAGERLKPRSVRVNQSAAPPLGIGRAIGTVRPIVVLRDEAAELATHSVRIPSGGGGADGMDRAFVSTRQRVIARTARKHPGVGARGRKNDAYVGRVCQGLRAGIAVALSRRVTVRTAPGGPRDGDRLMNEADTGGFG